MEEQEKQIVEALQALQKGDSVWAQTSFGTGWLADAINDAAVAGCRKKAPAASPVVLLAEERDIYAYVAAPDPALLDHLAAQQEPVAALYGSVLQLAEGCGPAEGSAYILFAPDLLLRHLLKRGQRPLVFFPSDALALTEGETALQIRTSAQQHYTLTYLDRENGAPLPA